MDFKDKLLLDLLQNSLPLVERPYQKLGEKVGMSEANTLKRLKRLKEEKYIRHIGALINTPALGFKSQLVGVHVNNKNISHAAQIINSCPGVTHNYLRDNYYNLWFTIAVPSYVNMKRIIEILMKSSRVDEYIELPSLKTYKLRFILNLTGRIKLHNKREEYSVVKNASIPSKEKEIVTLIQNSLDIIEEPFKKLAWQLDQKPGELLKKIKGLMKKRVIRRWGGIISHLKLGYKYNVMVVWRVPDRQIDRVGRRMAKYTCISHCYKRAIYPDWPYQLYTMLHCKSSGQAQKIIDRISKENKIKDFLCLVTMEELKKKRLKYFTSEFDNWLEKKSISTALVMSKDI